LPNWEFSEGEVYYFDPYNDVPQVDKLEFWKPFSYAYQKEYRCVVRSKNALDQKLRLAPVYVELGSLEDIAEVVTSNDG
jgi:hypothetical protein